jgi:Fungal specific transcription factor domain
MTLLTTCRSFDAASASRSSHTLDRTEAALEDYAKLRGPSLLKTTLGLQNHRYARYIGPTAEYESALLDLRPHDDSNGESSAGRGSFRRISEADHFWQLLEDPEDKTRDIEALDKIEEIVAPHGEALVKLYFRIVHPSFPILHKKVFLEKYGRTHREFSPPLLAAVYILALNWWSYSSDLVQLRKPEVGKLEELAFCTLQDVAHRAKLSTVQAGLLLLQRPQQDHSWMLIAQLVAIGQDLGLHLDCSTWYIPSWEKGLRKRLAWALFMQDIWSALVYGRPPHISLSNWDVREVTGNDFPESSADEDDEDGSSEVEKGRTLLSAMIVLSKMLSDVLETLYSLKAEANFRRAINGTKCVLEKAKPIQLKLRAWYSNLPDCLHMDNLKPRRLSSQGYLHLAYFATEITLHRRIVRSLSADTDPYLTQICRSAAKSRLVSALDFFNRLKPEHLQSFWYFASKVNFALIGAFNSLLWVTAISPEEAEFYQRRLQEYRWTLRVSSKSAEFLEVASNILESAVGTLLKATDSAAAMHLSSPTTETSQARIKDATIDAYFAGAELGDLDMTMESYANID